jgi:hypothetical protein
LGDGRTGHLSSTADRIDLKELADGESATQFTASAYRAFAESSAASDIEGVILHGAQGPRNPTVLFLEPERSDDRSSRLALKGKGMATPLLNGLNQDLIRAAACRHREPLAIGSAPQHAAHDNG